MQKKGRSSDSTSVHPQVEVAPFNPAHVNAQLLIVRYLLAEGVRALSTRLPHAAGLAVSLFQDSAELLLACIAHALDARVGSQTRFMDYWDAIESAPLNKEAQKVPSKAALGRLNSMRVGFKHRGQLPLLEDAESARTDTEVFVRQSASVFLGIDFDDVSLADLVSNDSIRNAIKTAEGAMREGRYEEGFIQCALAADAMPDPVGQLSDPTTLHRLATAVRDLDLGRQTQTLRDMVAYIADRLAVHDKLLLRMLGHGNLVKRERFQKLTPRVVRFAGGRTEFRWNRRMSTDGKQVEDELRFCIDYVTGLALAPGWPLIPR